MKYTALGALMLSGSLLAFSIQDAVVKLLSEQYAVLQVLTIRIVFVLFIVLGICLLRYGVGSCVQQRAVRNCAEQRTRSAWPDY